MRSARGIQPAGRAARDGMSRSRAGPRSRSIERRPGRCTFSGSTVTAGSPAARSRVRGKVDSGLCVRGAYSPLHVRARRRAEEGKSFAAPRSRPSWFALDPVSTGLDWFPPVLSRTASAGSLDAARGADGP